MKGHILDFSAEENSGIITGDDGQRYNFASTEWKNDGAPARGMAVDFDHDGNTAKAVYRALGGQKAAKDRRIAAWIAILCGPFGVHKFYLGLPKAGAAYLIGSLLGGAVLFGIPLFILWAMSIYEGYTYLNQSDEDFERVLRENPEWG